MKGIPAIVLFMHCLNIFGQDSSSVQKTFLKSGYIKNLQTIRFNKNFRESVTNNILHNRINLKYRPSGKWTFDAEFRNRFFWGEEIKSTPDFSKYLRNQNEKFNLAITWIDNQTVVLHTNTERLWAEYRQKKWNIRAGRQRINWGVTTTWNPNDIFNSYNFLDFDYEERPGTDGIKLQVLLKDFSDLEIVTAYDGKGNKTNGALRYSWNKWQYDMHLIAGWFKEQITTGAGWAGNIGEAGFKGELQYFFPAKDKDEHLNISLEADYIFKDGWYVNTGLLFNDHGLTRQVNDWTEINLHISPENLMPARWNIMAAASKELTGLSSGRLTVVYSPGIKMLILFPSVGYNIATNLDADLSWQSFFIADANGFEAVLHMPFIRLKWSF